MKRVIANIGYGYCGTYTEEEFEFFDNATEEEIEECIWDYATQKVEVDWKIVEE